MLIITKRVYLSDSQTKEIFRKKKSVTTKRTLLYGNKRLICQNNITIKNKYISNIGAHKYIVKGK